MRSNVRGFGGMILIVIYENIVLYSLKPEIYLSD